MTQVKDDTMFLLKECNSGIKMGVSSIDDVLPKVKDEKLKKVLELSKHEHGVLGNETRDYLNSFDCDGKEPHPMAKVMSWTKTNTKLAIDESDKTIADLITSGCDMGIKSLNKYLNQYENADEKVRELTGKIIKLEEKLRDDIKEFL